jgi:hypothetical protein
MNKHILLPSIISVILYLRTSFSLPGSVEYKHFTAEPSLVVHLMHQCHVIYIQICPCVNSDMLQVVSDTVQVGQWTVAIGQVRTQAEVLYILIVS